MQSRVDDTTSLRNRQKGRALLITTAILWSINGALIKIIHQGGAGPNAWVMAFYRSLFAGMVLTPAAVRRFGKLRWTPWWIASVLAFSAMTVSFILANTMTTAANAIVLQYTAPVWVFLFSPLIVRERPAARDWPILALAMVGVAVIFFGHGASASAGLIVALSSGLAFGLLTLILRRLRNVDPILVAWINNIGSAAVLLPIVAAHFDFQLAQRALVLLVVMGVFQFALPYVLFSWGLRYVPAAQAVLIILLEPVLNPLWAWTAVQETPGLETIIGGLIILSAVVWQAARR